MFKIIRNRKNWYILSISLILISAVFLLIFGLRIGIDYQGGTILDIKSSNQDIENILKQSLKSQGIESYQIKPSGEDSFTIRTKEISNEQKNQILEFASSQAPDINEISFDSIGPLVGKDLTNKSIIAVSIASIAIIIFIAFSFRRVPKPLSSWKFGVLAVLALMHDLFIVFGFASSMGHYFVWMEVDALFITALLTIMGFSVHDTIVIYDRLRENFIKNKHKSIEAIAEESVNQTLARSINTSLVTILVLISLLLLGAPSIRHFILILVFGIFIGTYSSIFVAAPLLVSWHSNTKNSSN